MVQGFCKYNLMLILVVIMFNCLVFADNSGSINVKDFGAKGDNVTDDTKALQDAFKAQEIYPYKQVVFPAGTYRIRDTITMYSPNVIGEGPVTLYQETAGKDIFYVKFAWRGRISNLSFHGGAKQLNLRNLRVDQGLLLVESCSFNECSDFALYMELQSNPMHFIIRSCHFNFCEQVLHTPCDWTTMSDCWITTARMVNKAAIEARGAKLLCENIVGVPIVTGKNDRWIDNYGSLTCRNFRFGGEFGGMTPVYNKSPLSRSMAGPVVLLEDCWVSAQGSGRKCAVYLEEIPNILTIRNCALTVPAVLVDPKIDLKTYFKHVRPGLLQFDIQHNTGEYEKDPQTVALLAALNKRDTSPEPITGQIDAKTTKTLLARIAEKVKVLSMTPSSRMEANGHQQKSDPKDYLELASQNTRWDVNDLMDATTVKNSEYVAFTPSTSCTIFMRRAPNGVTGAWPHVLIRNVEIDLDKTPWLAWKQKDPGPDPLPKGAVLRSKEEKLDESVTMPMGFALRIIDNETQRVILLQETHTPPWFDYATKDLRKEFGFKGGKRFFTIKYYPLGVYITGRPGSGFALPGEYQLLEFIRAEAD